MMYKTFFLLMISSLIIACSNPQKDERTIFIDNLTNLEQQCFDDATNTYNSKVALKTLTEYQKFIEKFPEDSLVPHYLYLSGQLCKSINMYGEAIRKLEILTTKYPTDAQASKAKLLVGMIYENDIKDTAKAKIAYQEFIEQYPNSDLVDDVQFLIQNLSLTDEELIQLLVSKSEEDSLI